VRQPARGAARQHRHRGAADRRRLGLFLCARADPLPAHVRCPGLRDDRPLRHLVGGLRRAQAARAARRRAREHRRQRRALSTM
jgi:hypothetical protein